MKPPTLRCFPILLACLSTATPDLLTAAMSPESPASALYNQHCAACHGLNGDGKGPAAVWLFPKPRNFSAGLFKIQSTPAGALPTDEDLFQTISRGMAGSSMPSFNHLPESERRLLVEHTKYLTAEVDAAGTRVNKFEQAARAGDRPQPVTVPPEPPPTFEAITRGKELFATMQCNSCHGDTGAGDGPQAAGLKDSFGLPLPPRDFTIGAFRGGSTGRDLYLRIHNGLAGTPMPPYGEGTMTPEDRWAVVLYIQSLRRKEAEVNDLLAPEEARIPVRRLSKLPADPLDPKWETYDPVRVPLNPLWPEPYPVPAVAVLGLHDGRQLALHCVWKDDTLNGAPVRVQDFQDGIAAQFALGPGTPFLGMGDASHPVNLWFWRAGWQQEIDGPRPDVELTYASLHVDTYFQPERQFQTAGDAGNILAQPRKSPVEDANAHGFGSLTTQPPAAQNVRGKGVWKNGFWHVVFLRDLKSRDPNDVKLVRGEPILVSFAVWNGEQRDRNGRKVVSNWNQLILDP